MQAWFGLRYHDACVSLIVAKIFRKTIKSNPDININLKMMWLPTFIQHEAQPAVSSPARPIVDAIAAPQAMKNGQCIQGKKNLLLCVNALQLPLFLLWAGQTCRELDAEFAFWANSFKVFCCSFFLSPSIYGHQRCIHSSHRSLEIMLNYVRLVQ